MKVKIKDHMNKNKLKISKDSNGLYYKVQKSNNDFTISYDNTKTVTNIEITGDNVSLDDVSNLTEYSKEDLQAFNFLDGDMNNFYKTLKRKVA
ncbi:hypothetical protein [Halarcobacter ebronensis]|uniref:Uncharacterized protein n=1 Tax=Halarcobacter ebronensis TaxID=1462615 RepID=A0A4Q1AN93_9BACT|nr:hypothetical protein [Halarcobacter ebronensis]QKF82393.1 hypothetical protein AEBR_1913 [Halarcobacter ebronensis]RXK07584.1 hypothetical protein CRV07_03735 [Halarcobacter ebronensis]